MSGTVTTIKAGKPFRLIPADVGCADVCTQCWRCKPLMWALEKWTIGWSIPQMRNELDVQSFVDAAYHYTAVAVLRDVSFQAELIARRLKRYWTTTIEQIADDDFRLTITDKHRGGRDEFVMRVSDDSLFASRYLLHAVLFTPRDVFPMVAKSFGALVKQ